jgi:hypothetical protein
VCVPIYFRNTHLIEFLIKIKIFSCTCIFVCVCDKQGTAECELLAIFHFVASFFVKFGEQKKKNLLTAALLNLVTDLYVGLSS